MVFTIIATVELKNESDIEGVQKRLLDCAESYRKDEGTIDWHVCQDTKDPKKFMLIERYESPASIAVHKANPHFEGFMDWINGLSVDPISVKPYNELPKL